MGNLVLRRCVGEQIVIGERIIVTLLAIEGPRAKLSILAPEDVQIVRKELLDEVANLPEMITHREGKGDA